MNHDNQLTSEPNKKCCEPTVMAADDMMDEELRLCFNIDVTEDEFYQNIKPEPVNIFDSDRSFRNANLCLFSLSLSKLKLQILIF